MNLRPLLRVPLAFEVDSLWFSADGGSVVARGACGGALVAVPSGAAIAAGDEVPRGRHAFSRAGDLVAVGGAALRVLDARTGATRAAVDTSDVGPLADVAVSPDASLAAAVSSSGRAALVELPGGRRRATFGGYTSRERWSCTTTIQGARFDHNGGRLLTFGTTEESTWGVAAHHGDPDQIDDREDFLTVWDVATGRELATDAEARSRHVTAPRTADWVPGADRIVTARAGQGFRLLTDRLLPCAGEWAEEEFRELHAAPDGRRVVAVEPDGGATLWTLADGFALVERRAFEADVFNGFGLPTVPGEAAPRFRVLATPDGVLVESWPAREPVARATGSARRVAVRPQSLGASFATAGDGALTLWALEPSAVV